MKHVNKIIKRWAKKIRPSKIISEYAYQLQRRRFEVSLSAFQEGHQSELNSEGYVLVDGLWDNPNYWLHQSLIMRSLGITPYRRVGLVGFKRKRVCRRTFKRLNFEHFFEMDDCLEHLERNKELAQNLLNSCKTSRDILNWDLPHHVPASALYDQILRDQRNKTVDLKHQRILMHVTNFLNSISSSEKVISQFQSNLVITNHGCGRTVPLIWLALKKRIPVLVLWDQFGTLRHRYLRVLDDFENIGERPLFSHYHQMNKKQKDDFITAGRDYLKLRLQGKTEDMGGVYAYQKGKETINRDYLIREFGWDKNKKIIAVYASNWFDYPHTLGMKNFSDFYDWINATLEIARENTDVQWLFKGHPAEEWYGGSSLKEIIGTNQPRHISNTSKDWNGQALLEAVDGVVTYHGTVGIEAAALRKPVLISDQGQYHDWGMSRYPLSRGEYLALLKTPWWENLDLDHNQHLAQVYAGLYWGRPSWHKSYAYQDDTLQWDLYPYLQNFLSENEIAIKKEILILRDWILSGAIHYHTYKLMQEETKVSA